MTQPMTEYRIRTEARIARIKADEHAEKVREQLVSKTIDYGMAMMALSDPYAETPFRERNAVCKALFDEILALSLQLRDAAKGA